MARLGLMENWNCIFANDFDSKKCNTYSSNFPNSNHLFNEDIRLINPFQLPPTAYLSWASFPCQDLSQAGKGGGLQAERSGTFWHFLTLMNGLNENRPPIIVLENVVGLLSSNHGDDFKVLIQSLFESEYDYGVLLLDAVHFLPQSRPRLFIVAVDRKIKVPSELIKLGPVGFGHSKRIIKSFNNLPRPIRDRWIWWQLPHPKPRSKNLIDIVEQIPTGVSWDTPEKTLKLLDMMSPTNRDKVKIASQKQELVVGSIYKRTRLNKEGQKVQRAEIRFDGISGALRTPAGGSSRQILLFVNGEEIRSRLISPRETARLMGVPDSYQIPTKYNEAYHLFGDGVAVPVVKWLDQFLLSPLYNYNLIQLSQTA